MKHLKTFNETLGKDDSQKWALYAGLSGGFGGAQFQESFEGSKSEAESHAYQLAVEEYESYVGLHGLRTTDQIMEEDDIEDESEAESIYNEEMEGWLDYWVEPYDENKDYE